MSLHLKSPRRSALVAALLLAVACQDAPTTPATDGPHAPVDIRAELAGTGVQALSVQVTGPAIASPIVVNVPVGTNVTVASATLSLPVGGQRTLLVRGFDGDGIQTHEGLATVTVRPAANGPVVVRLYPKVGDVPISIGGASYTIVITPGTLPDANVGDTRQLSVVVGDATGAPVSGATVAWGSLNPVVASIAANGQVTARTAGTTTLYASWGGAVASVDLVVLGPPQAFREIAAGLFSTCAIDDAGAAWCWGDGAYGALGNGEELGRSRRPSAVAGGLRFASITVGRHHACAVTLTAQGYCWGYNGGAQLGTGLPLDSRTVPTLVVGGLAWVRLSAGFKATCGITTAGARYCWGSDTYGELGLHLSSTDPTTFAVPTPVAIDGGPWSGIDVAAGRSCAVATSGAASCTELLSPGGSFLATPPGTDWRAVEVSDVVAPDDVNGNVSGGLLYGVLPTACGLSAAGEVRCWGRGAHGALGAGSVADAATPALVTGQQGYDAISLGGDFACALRSRIAICWGRNDAGQLGDGTTTDRLVPTAVSGGGSFMRIAAGLGHACALRADGAAFCWGDNGRGQLGDGTTTSRHAPTLVARPLAP